MKNKENTSIYIAEEGCLIIRKKDRLLMGDCIDLGSVDCIDNYEDKEYSKEELDAYYTTLRNTHSMEQNEFINPLTIITKDEK